MTQISMADILVTMEIEEAKNMTYLYRKCYGFKHAKI
jgi:hypothetical protein